MSKPKNYSVQLPGKGTKRAIIVYHDKCNDGLVAAFFATDLAAIENPDLNTTTWIACDYSEESNYEILNQLRLSEEPTIIYIVDYSIPMALLISICALPYVERVDIKDHHKTAKEIYNLDYVVDSSAVGDQIVGYPIDTFQPAIKAYIKYSEKASGALIVFRELQTQLEVSLQNNYEMYRATRGKLSLAVYVSDRDLWEFRFDATKYIHHVVNEIREAYEGKGMAGILSCFYDLERLCYDLCDMYSTVINRGKELHEAYVDTVTKLSGKWFSIQLHDTNKSKGVAVYADGKFASDVGNLLADIADFVLIIPPVLGEEQPEDLVKYSLRSKKGSDIDVSELAKQFGGGGHKHAAGFMFKRSAGVPFTRAITVK